jgi:hypothetical protein
VNEWRQVVSNGLTLIVFMELVEIARWVLSDGWSGVLRFHLRLNRQLLLHGISSVYAGAVYGIATVFGWRAFRDAPLIVVAVLVALLLLAVPFRPFLRTFFQDTDLNTPAQAHELPFPR